MKIIYYDEDIVVCQKDAGELSEGMDRSSLPRLISEELARMGESKTEIFPVHRLDKDTLGVIVFARSSSAAAKLSAHIQSGSFSKEYLAVCHGVPQSKSDRLCDLLYYDRGRGKSFVVDKKRAGVRRAELEYTLKQSTSGLSLLAVKLFTGRTHQIRVQFASRKNPLCGDRRYGAPKGEASTPALLSHKLTFPHPTKCEIMTFVCEAPKAYPWNIFDI